MMNKQKKATHLKVKIKQTLKNPQCKCKMSIKTVNRISLALRKMKRPCLMWLKINKIKAG